MDVKKENTTNETEVLVLLIFKEFRGRTGHNSRLVMWLYPHKDSIIEKKMIICIVLTVCLFRVL